MKRFLTLSLITATALLVSCVEQTFNEPDYEEIMATAQLPEFEEGFTGTKSVVKENSSGLEMIWGTSESIGVYGRKLTNSKYTGTNKYYEQASTTFKGTTSSGSPEYAYYPYSAENSSNNVNNVRGELPSLQFFSTILKRMNTDYKIGVYSSRTWNGYKFSFSHILTFLKFTVNADGTALEGDKLQSISVTVMTANGQPRQVTGKFTFDLTKSNTSAIKSWDAPEEGANKITLAFNDAPLLSKGATYRGYASAAPLSVPGDVLYFEVFTDKHKATFSRTSKATFSANKIVNFPLTLSTFSDMVVTDVVPNVSGGSSDDDDILGNLSDVTPVLNSFKFTVAANSGKILSRKFSHNSSFTVSTSSVQEEVCTVDQTNKKVTLYVPYLNNRKLVPTFEIPEGTALVYDGNEIKSGETEVDFTKCKEIQVVNGVGDSVTYTVELTNTGLPVVVINQLSGTTHNESDSEYTKASNAWYKATGTEWQPKDSDWSMEEGDNFMIYNADGTSALTKDGAAVNSPVLASTRIRGNVTQQMPKKPFAVKLDKKHGVLGMPAHKRWVLLANWKDRTLMRNDVAFGIADVFKATFPNDGIAWNPSGQHVELVYNGVYVGNYYLCEQIKIDGNRLDINDPYDAEDGYSGNPEDYGYLLEADDGYDETYKFTTACYVPFLFKDDGNSDMLTYASNFVRGIEDNLYSGNYDAAFEKMDLTSFVDFWLIQELMMNSEAKHPKSCYNYINDGVMYAGPIWDFDWNTLPTSSSYSEESFTYTTSMLSKSKAYHKRSGYPSEPKSNDKNYIWYPLLVKNATFKSLAASRWNAVKGAIETYVNNEIPKVQAAIAKSEAENNKMWPVDSGSGSWGTKRYSTYGIGGGFCGDEGKSFSDAVSTMQSTLRTRISGMSYVSNQNWPSVSYTNQ